MENNKMLKCGQTDNTKYTFGILKESKSQEENKDNIIYCESCGKQYIYGNKYCPSCGAKIE